MRYKWISPGRFWVVELPNADPASFDVLGFNLARDQKRVWWFGAVLPGVDAATVELVRDGFVWKDANHVWFLEPRWSPSRPAAHSLIRDAGMFLERHRQSCHADTDHWAARR